MKKNLITVLMGVGVLVTSTWYLCTYTSYWWMSFVMWAIVAVSATHAYRRTSGES